MGRIPLASYRGWPQNETILIAIRGALGAQGDLVEENCR